MTVITDSSPLIALLGIKKVELLDKLFDTVIIPEAVHKEVFGSKVGNKDLEKARFLRVKKVKNKKIVELLRMQLDHGESEVIALAFEEGIDRVIIDDKQARKIAERLGLKLIGTLGILMLAKEKQIIKEVRPLVLAMMERTNFRINKVVLNRLLKILDEEII